MQYFNYCTGLTMTNDAFHRLFGGEPRAPESLLDAARHGSRREHPGGDRGGRREARARRGGARRDSATSASPAASRSTASRTASSCASASSTASGCSRRRATPAARSARRSARTICCSASRATVVGAATRMRGAFLGPRMRSPTSSSACAAAGARYEVLDDDALIDASARALADGKALGWHQGRMEFGPRALGGRSILGDPRSPTMQKTLNLRSSTANRSVRSRPPCCARTCADWFELDVDSPYMLLVADVAPGRRIAMTRSGEGAVRDRQAERSALDDPRRDARRLLGARPDGPPRHQSALSRAASAVQGADRLPGPRQHSFNVRGEPIVAHARGRVPLLHGDRHRDARGRQLPAREGRAGPCASKPIRIELRPGLIRVREHEQSSGPRERSRRRRSRSSPSCFVVELGGAAYFFLQQRRLVYLNDAAPCSP